MYQSIVHLYEWEGTAGQPASKVARIDYDYFNQVDQVGNPGFRNAFLPCL
jgi:hypothetical protein